MKTALSRQVCWNEMLNAHEDGILNDFNVRRSNGLGGLQRFRHRRGLQPATPERHQLIRGQDRPDPCGLDVGVSYQGPTGGCLIELQGTVPEACKDERCYLMNLSELSPAGPSRRPDERGPEAAAGVLHGPVARPPPTEAGALRARRGCPFGAYGGWGDEAVPRVCPTQELRPGPSLNGQRQLSVPGTAAANRCRSMPWRPLARQQ